MAGEINKPGVWEAIKRLGLGTRPKEEEINDGIAPEAAAEPIIGKKSIEQAISILKDYKDGKRNLESRIVEEEKWWKLRHWDVVRGGSAKDDRPEPTSAWLFNSIANKHADIMDNYPEPNVLPRERADEKDADTLSAILPVVFERNEYEQTYSQAAWYKLKHGVAAKGVFWNQDREEGLGDVDIRFVDILNVFWEPGITDLQCSRNLFVVSLKDNDILETEYPELKGKLGGQIIDVKQYVHDDSVDISDKALVVDWYYKKRTPEGKTVLHLCKFVGSNVLFSSEDNPEYAENGFYAHGRYPIEFDVLFPEEGTPVGFGFISIMKSPQLYIDKLSQVILENSMASAKPRWFVKNSAGINKDQLLDWSDPLVEYEGDPDNIKPFEVAQVGGNVLNVLQMKIDELKETSSNRDFSQGASSGGVTAAAAIAALQEAGNKTSRDMITASYRSYTQECYLVIELIRQFYDEMRSFRITGDRGQNEYIQFSNQQLQPKPIPPAYAGQELQPGYVPQARKPIFDIVVKPQKRSPYSKMAQNELAKELYNLGFFNPQLADQSLAALDLMDFDGQEKVRDKVQQGQTMLMQIQMLTEQMHRIAAMLYAETGQDVLGVMQPQGAQRAPQRSAQVPQGKSMGQAQKEAQTANMTSYGQRLAAHAKPNMEAQG
jgi:hypothetical protein